MREIHHIDGEATNNDIANLRIVGVKVNLTLRELAAERSAARIKRLSNPTHADYKRIIDEEYRKVGL